ncbi:hypothetical protein [Methylophilus aquaticus]|uniref:Uncharacterized protein n=1 Tax=Methylophilus aquaticus TaxID=1971610 RepID=A0ABT9JRF0_9PROT|nr:hypothetical protein [Methylophilus aquaticus]MDP8567167.1 hypothetical protein [Methylophilus aquaticus]
MKKQNQVNEDGLVFLCLLFSTILLTGDVCRHAVCHAHGCKLILTDQAAIA